MKPIDLKVDVIGSGPSLSIDGRERLAPQFTIALSSAMTYKSGSAIEIAEDSIKNIKDEARNGLKEGEDLEERVDEILYKKLKDSLINSAGRGHASLSTSAGIWCLFRDSSKFVDSMFTGAIYSSSLMPSGRRIPVNVEGIVAPESIFNGDNKVKETYYETSRKNIEFYKLLIEKGVSKEDAAKITQYGILGGGFIYLPLETIIGYKHEFEIEKGWTPRECHEFITQIEGQLKGLGMDILYWARNYAPRNTINYPNIFTDPKKGSLVKNMIQKLSDVEKPFVNIDFSLIDDYFNRDVSNLIKLSQEITKDEDSLNDRWRELLLARKDFVKRYNGVISFSSLSDVSWRVWGEVKRHRTLEQSVESVYHAIDRARDIINENRNLLTPLIFDNKVIDEISQVFVIPDDIKKKGLANEWISKFVNSIDTYEELVSYGIPASDALCVVPRGLKLSVFKRFNLYNLLDGYLPLRLCGTAEPEMRRTTEIETKKILSELNNWDSSISYRNLSKLIGPKCSASGFCLEPWKGYCGKVKEFIGIKYSKKFHDEMDGIRKGLIYSKL